MSYPYYPVTPVYAAPIYQYPPQMAAPSPVSATQSLSRHRSTSSHGSSSSRSSRSSRRSRSLAPHGISERPESHSPTVTPISPNDSISQADSTSVRERGMSVPPEGYPTSHSPTVRSIGHSSHYSSSRSLPQPLSIDTSPGAYHQVVPMSAATHSSPGWSTMPSGIDRGYMPVKARLGYMRVPVLIPEGLEEHYSRRHRHHRHRRNRSH